MTQQALRWFFFVQCQLLLIMIYAADGFEGGADAINHWLISRDAPSDPMLFLNQWNKPVFTLLSAPFAQFGLIGMRLFSAATGILTGLILYRTVKEKFGELSWLPAIFLLMLPKYVELLTSSMTEPLFALFLALFILLIQQNKYGAMALIAGVSPFVRQEGMALVAVGFVVLMVLRKWRQIPLLFAGAVVMAIIGWAVSGDVRWILTSFPYSSAAAEIYGSGDLFDYFHFYRELFGNPVSVLFVIGLLFMLISVLKRASSSLEIALIAGSAFAFMFVGAHSFVWWKGLSGSLGLIRVMASIAPVVALLGGYGLFSLFHILGLRKHTVLQSVLLLPVLAASAYEVHSMTELPTPNEESGLVMQETVDWLKDQKDLGEIYYSNPVLSYYATEVQLAHRSYGKSSVGPDRLDELNAGDVVIWDAHFSPNEGRLPLEKLLNHPYYLRVKSFKPDKAFIVLGNHPYEVHAFQKTATPVRKQTMKHLLIAQDFEADESGFLIVNEGRNGSKCAVADKQHEFVTIKQEFTRSSADTLVGLKVEAWIKPTQAVGKRQLFLVSDISGMHYLSVDVPEIPEDQTDTWHLVQQSFVLPAQLSESFTLKCYIWNPDGLKVLVDDLKLEAESFSQQLP